MQSKYFGLFCIVLLSVICFGSAGLNRPLSLSKVTKSKSKSPVLSKFIQGGQMQIPNPAVEQKNGNPNPMLIKSARQGLYKNVMATWGIIQVLTMLSQSIYRLYPIAVQPIIEKSLTQNQMVAYLLWVLIMLYSEGYKGFHKKFSPLVVRRAFAISDNLNPLNALLAGPYSMGLFGATKKRLTVSWMLVTAVVAMIVLVRKLPVPYKAIVDGGVVAGLSGGALSIIWLYIRALLGQLPDVDPCLRDNTKND